MSEEKSKLIPFSKELEDIIEADAKRCQRSFVRQVVAVLMNYYEVADVEINRDRPRLEMIGALAPHSKHSLPMIEATVENPKKKKTA